VTSPLTVVALMTGGSRPALMSDGTRDTSPGPRPAADQSSSSSTQSNVFVTAFFHLR